MRPAPFSDHADYDDLERPHHPLCPSAYGAGECECAELSARDYDDAMESRYGAWRDDR